MCRFVFGGILPDRKHILHTGIGLTVRIVWQKRIVQALIQCKFTAIVGYFEHIVNACIHTAVSHDFRSLAKSFHHRLLFLAEFQHHIGVLCFWNRKFQHIRGLDVCRFLKDCHQLRQIEKAGKPCLCPVARSFRCQLHRCHRFAKGRCPGIKVSKVHFHQRVVLQIPHQRVKLCHTVRDRRTGCKRNATASGKLIHITAFCKHIGAFLRFSLGNTGNIPHFCIEEQVFEPVALVHKQSVHAQLLKGDNIIFLALVIQTFQPCLQ